MRFEARHCRASYCEIYNEALYDLLNFTNQQLAIRWDATKGFYVPDLYVKECAEIQDLLQVSKTPHPLFIPPCLLCF